MSSSSCIMFARWRAFAGASPGGHGTDMRACKRARKRTHMADTHTRLLLISMKSMHDEKMEKIARLSGTTRVSDTSSRALLAF